MSLSGECSVPDQPPLLGRMLLLLHTSGDPTASLQLRPWKSEPFCAPAGLEPSSGPQGLARRHRTLFSKSPLPAGARQDQAKPGGCFQEGEMGRGRCLCGGRTLSSALRDVWEGLWQAAGAP